MLSFERCILYNFVVLIHNDSDHSHSHHCSTQNKIISPFLKKKFSIRLILNNSTDLTLTTCCILG